ncbi:MAG TPA: alkaline phosphatase family protein [Solirubrobacterales bacterium]|nr:alkaline phosphatase family protein [Solirubrobacterales bacterium]
MKLAFYAYLQKAIAAAATVTGKKFGLLVATSLIATSGIAASAMTDSGGIGPVTAAAVAGLFDGQPAAVTTAEVPEAAPEESFSSPSSPEASSAPEVTSEALPESAPSAAPESLPSPRPETPDAPPPSEPELPEAGPVKHVFLISLASPGYEAAFGAASQMPYLSATLRQQGVLLTNYSLLDGASLANGFAAISGQKPTAASQADCPEYEKCLFPVETLSLADQLSTGQFTWHAYLGDMTDPEGKPDNCVHPEPDAPEVPPTGGYASKLNPFVYFHSLLDLGDCAANDVPLSELAGDLKKPDSTANFSYIAPNLCDSGFRGQCPEGAPDGAAAADAYLGELVPEILSSPAYKKDGLVIVSFGAADPAASADPAAAPADPLKVGALLISPLLTPGGTDAAAYTPYSLLRSTDELFGLSPLGDAKGKKVHSFASAFVAGETAAGD